MASTATPPPPYTQELDSIASCVPFLTQEQFDTESGPIYVHVSVTGVPWLTVTDAGVNVIDWLKTPKQRK